MSFGYHIYLITAQNTLEVSELRQTKKADMFSDLRPTYYCKQLHDIQLTAMRHDQAPPIPHLSGQPQEAIPSDGGDSITCGLPNIPTQTILSNLFL